MSITDELRESVMKECGHMLGAKCDEYYELLAIADRIDAEHERQVADAFETRNSDENLESDGWVRLPVDADGEYIHVGDTMYDRDYDPKTQFTAVEMLLLNNGWELIDFDGARYVPTFCCHYHAPTVEDVLEEYRVEYYDIVTDMECENIDNDEYVRSIKELNSKYAAKLRLAGDES